MTNDDKGSLYTSILERLRDYGPLLATMTPEQITEIVHGVVVNDVLDRLDADTASLPHAVVQWSVAHPDPDAPSGYVHHDLPMRLTIRQAVDAANERVGSPGWPWPPDDPVRMAYRTISPWNLMAPLKDINAARAARATEKAVEKEDDPT